MFFRALPMVLVLLSNALPAAAQRMDILTGEPVRPPNAHPRPEPEIFNAPHAPRQVQGRGGDSPPMDIYVAPQIGTGNGYSGANGGAGLSSGRSYQQRVIPRSRPQYPDRLEQERRY